MQELPQVELVWEPHAPTCGGFVQPLAVPDQHPVLRVQWIINREREKSTAVVFRLYLSISGKQMEQELLLLT